MVFPLRNDMGSISQKVRTSPNLGDIKNLKASPK